ncbi:MAG: glutathione S-transferase N-terminal domain-containing protein [Xanthomonadales bacterium]|nr:glutathione S-transferase N-terminal domain-containing protein [Xanthomonadales bacterium]
MKLYYLPGACPLAVHIVLEWIGRPFDAVRMSRSALKSPEYLALNPNGSVPTLVEDDGWVLVENVAILNYLADSHPQAGLGGDGSARGRARVNRWLGMLNSDVHKAFLPLFQPGRFLDDGEQHDALKAKAREAVRTLLARIDADLAGDGRPWLAGDQPSIADPYLYVVLRWAAGTGVELDGLQALAAFRSRIEADPAVQRALAAEGLTT